MALEQHAIPTQVTSYEFRLVGNMTIKQFGWLASGLILALIAYSLPLPGYIRWVLIILLAPSGAAVAFIPIEGRSIDRWIISFIKAIYSPTEFIWTQERPVLDIFKKNTTNSITSTVASAKTTASDQERLQEYLKTLPYTTHTSDLDEKENRKLSMINKMFENELDAENLDQNFNSQVTVNASDDTAVSDLEIKQTMANINNSQPPAPKSINLGKLEKKVSNILGIKSVTKPKEKTEETSEEIKPSDVEVETTTPPPPKTESTQSQTPYEIQTSTPAVEQNGEVEELVEASKTPLNNFKYQIPAPTKPNLVVGVITDSAGRILDNAIIEIKDTLYKPVRALKTNKLGQFATATSLRKGKYIIEVDKEGYQFEPVTIEAQGQIVPPVYIQAK